MKPEDLERAVNEFNEIFKEEFGYYLTKQEATEKALGLLDLFEILYKPTEKKP